MVRFKRGVGSSPLTRGKRRVTLIDRSVIGLIPAHAGKTRRRFRRARTLRAHPRSRGENYLAACLLCGVMGSSPLTRGKRYKKATPWVRLRLIPAHAGKTPRPHRRSQPRRAHPRSRGENGGQVGRPDGHGGSSPLTRGKLLDDLGQRGIRLAHPRSRGENDPEMLACESAPGSSPLTRGKLGAV